MFDAEWAATRIQDCAKAYETNLLDRHVLFIPSDGSLPLDCLFRDDNFMHLCKVFYGHHSPAFFFREARNGRLDPDLLSTPNERQMIAKLAQLPILCHIDAKANAAIRNPVDHQGTYADLFCSNMIACLGFKELVGGLYVPKTALAYNPPRSEPGYVNLIASARTMPNGTVFTEFVKLPKTKDRTRAKRAMILRSLDAYPDPTLVEPLHDLLFNPID